MVIIKKITPVIGIPYSINSGNGQEPQILSTLNQAYPAAIEANGGKPLLLCLKPGLAAQKEAIGQIDGLLLPGGGDIDPAFYGENPMGGLIGVSRARDEGEFTLLQGARARHLPVLGICRGLQLITVAYGGALWQDVAAQKPGAHRHDFHGNDLAHDYPAHPIQIAPGSRLHSIVGEKLIEVNSLHHQAIKRMGAGLVATAVAADGVIEAIEIAKESFFVAVQWHPEEMYLRNDPAHRLFAAFIEACTGPAKER
jgi:putative glutamine amidotransferase